MKLLVQSNLKNFKQKYLNIKINCLKSLITQGRNGSRAFFPSLIALGQYRCVRGPCHGACIIDRSISERGGWLHRDSL